MAELQMVLFKLGEVEFGVPIAKVQEIIKTPAITGLPNSPGFLRGVINLRDKVVPVVDLSEKLGLGRRDAEDSRVVIVNVLGNTVGLTVDFVTEVLKLEEKQIETDLESCGKKNPIIAAIAKVDQRLIILLNLDELLTTAETFLLNEETIQDIKTNGCSLCKSY
ncbi:MAG: chemotaxis protein CheW [Bacillota bacterium]|nr:chemotaxis protein CheW [Bacillota bacterium]